MSRIWETWSGLVLVLRTIPDEGLMRVLERVRGQGRDEYPVRAVWNSLLAGVVCQHASVAELRRELLRNAQLREVCGFNVLVKVEAAVPPAWVYTRFFRLLFKHAERVDAMFDGLVASLHRELPGFGRCLAGDGKAIPTHARAPKKDAEPKAPDGRRDTDADWGAKTKKRTRDDGTSYKKITLWFGYKLHLVVDADHELPVAYEITAASAGEAPIARALVKRLSERHKALMKKTCEVYLYDKAGDDTTLLKTLWDDHGIKPVIPVRACWQDGDEIGLPSGERHKTRRVPGTHDLVYTEKGGVYCFCPRTTAAAKAGKVDTVREMAFGGFEKDRRTLRYRCPARLCQGKARLRRGDARHYGYTCPGAKRCKAKTGVRIPLNVDRRVFTPLARNTYVWKRTCKKRTAVERVNSRLDVSYGFERHFIRGFKKMRLRTGLALVVMLSMALGRVREKRKDLARSLVRAA
jgi:DDE family transposase/transposase-like protein DUF772